MSGRVVVVGGGVAGLCCAYYLRRAGSRRDGGRDQPDRQRARRSPTAAGSAPPRPGPLPEPGLTLYGMRSLFDRDSALYFKPGDWNRLAPWLLRFWTYCNESDHAHGTAAIARLGYDVFDLVEEMRADGVEFELHKQGMVYAAQRADDARAELRKLAPMREYGLRAARRRHHRLGAARARAGAVPEGDRGLPRPPALARAPRLVRRPGSPTCCAGTASRSRRAPRSSSSSARGRRSRTFAPPPATSTRTWSCSRPGRGRRRSRARSGSRCRWRRARATASGSGRRVVPSHAILLADVHVGCTPFGDRIRIGGTMEFSGINNRLDRRRIDAIVAGAKASFVPWATPEIESEWAGMRPITADGLPVLDRAGALENTYIATGYAMQGVTLAPTSGRALAEMIATGQRPALLEPFRLDRFHRVPLPAGRTAPQRLARGRMSAHPTTTPRRDHRHREHRHRSDDQGRAEPVARARRDGGHRSRVRGPAAGARARPHRHPPRARGPARAGRRHRPGVRRDLGRRARRARARCWPRAGSEASTSRPPRSARRSSRR